MPAARIATIGTVDNNSSVRNQRQDARPVISIDKMVPLTEKSQSAISTLRNLRHCGLAHTVTSAVSSMNASSSSCTCHTPPSWGVTSSQAQSSSVGDRKRHWTNTAVPAVSSLPIAAPRRC